ncbi:MAG: hypothetical protein ACYDA9_07210 [Terriglobia bacterium]
MKRQRLTVFLLILAAPVTVRAQTTQSSDQTALVRELLERIDKLEKRVTELETRPTETMDKASAGVAEMQGASASGPSESARQESLSSSGATVASTGPVPVASKTPGQIMNMDHAGMKFPPDKRGEDSAASAQAHDDATAQVNPDEATQAAQTYPNLHIAGFGSIDYFATNQAHVPQSFTLGQLILHFSSELSPRVSFFSEWSVSGTGQDVRKLEVERAIIRYDFNDLLKVSFGRYHTPINYWNTAYHHGTWLQTSISRPEMIGFGGSFLPPHFVGLLAEGSTPADGLNFNYSIGAGNGRGFPFSQAGTTFDVNNNKAWLANFFIKPDRFAHLRVGGSVYHDLLTFPVSAGFSEREFVEAAHVVWDSEKPEFLAEFANVHHVRTDTGATFNSQAFYVQVAYRLPWFDQKFKPYYRIEYLHTPRTDPSFSNPAFGSFVQNEQGSSYVGLRYDFTTFAALKGEYNRQKRRDIAQPFKIFQLSTDFTF